MERFRACFAELEDPRTGNAQRHELAEIMHDRAARDLVRRRELRRHGAVRARQGAVAAALSRAAGRRPEPRHLLAAVPAARSRWASRPASPASSRPSSRTASHGVVAVDGKTARRSFDRQRGRGAAPSDQRLGGRAAPGAGPAQGRRRQQRDPGRCPSCSRCWRWTAGSSPPMPCTATRPRRRRSSTAAVTIASRSRPTSRRCWRTFGCCWTIRRQSPAIAPRPPTATTAASRPAVPRSCTRSPGWPKAMGFRASRRSAR